MKSYDQCPTPLLGFCAFSGTGKTTLLQKLIPYLKDQGLRLAVIKHAHHNFDVDHPEKDSYKLRHAGACEMLISSGKRWALMHELAENEPEWSLLQLLEKIDHANTDLILVEGFKKEPIQKIELHRPILCHPLLCPDDTQIIAVATDGTLTQSVQQAVLDLNNPQIMGEFILDFFDLR